MRHRQLFGRCLAVTSIGSNGYVPGMTLYMLGGRRMSLSPRDEGNDSDQVTGLNCVSRLVGHCKIPAWHLAKLPRYGREGAVEVRPFTAKKRLLVSEAQGLSGEAMKGNPTTTVIPGVDESKSSPQTTEDLTEPKRAQEPELVTRRLTRSTPARMRRKLTPVQGLRLSPSKRKDVSTPKTGTRFVKTPDLPAPIFETPSM